MKVKVTSLSVLLVSVFLLSALFGVQLVGLASAEGPYDWPLYGLDSQRSGHTESPAPNTNQTLWTTVISGGSLMSPVVADGRLYIGSLYNYVYCLDAVLGTQIWMASIGGVMYSNIGVADGRVYVGTNNNVTFCLDALTGAQIWNFTTGNWAASRYAVVEGRLYMGSDDTNFYCLDAATGTQIWNYTNPNGRIVGGSIVDGRVYFGSVDDHSVWCLDAVDGTFVWNYTTDGDVWASPTVSNGKVYVGSNDTNVYCLDAISGAKIWNYSTGHEIYCYATVTNGKVYVGSFDTNIYCLDATLGTKIWNYSTGSAVYAPPNVADGKVFATTMLGKVFCLNADTGTEIWSYDAGNALFYHGVIIANGVAYAAGWGGGNLVYAFGAEPPLTTTAWNITYGGTGDDAGTGETIQTSDEGYAISGDTNSSGAGGFDFWLFKTDADGNMEWNQTYGGVLDETIHDMCQTSDGGYAMSGTTESFGAGGTDAYLVKTDVDGNMEWNMTYGGTDADEGRTVIQTSDGGYAMTGTTYSYGAGGFDGWLIKIDADGNMEWNMTYGGTSGEDLDNVVQTDDGGYLFAGQTNSFGTGGTDGWLVKTDASGNMEWNQTYGGAGIDILYTIAMSDDGGYALAGFTTSSGNYKIYFVKTDENGNMLWNKTYATKQYEIAIHGISTSDGGYAIVGWNYANGQDFVLYKLDETGELEWNMTYGGTGLDNGYAILEASDGGYVLTGTTDSFGAGGTDVWLVKVDGSGVIPESFTVTVVVLLSTVSVAVSFWLLRKRPKLKNSLLEKP